jgi:hypothetical protein
MITGFDIRFKDWSGQNRGDILLQRIDLKRVTLCRSANVYTMEDVAFESSFIISDSDESMFTPKLLDIAFKSTTPGVSTILTHFLNMKKKKQMLTSISK